MSEDRTPRCYGAIPFRALRDKRLAGIPLALLGIIAAHDRFGHAGQGCTASQGRLAELVGCHRQAINAAIRRLEELGYISCGVFGKADRRMTYSVLYTEADAEAFSSKKDRPKRAQACPPQQTSPAPTCPPDRTCQAIENHDAFHETGAKTRSLAQAEYIPLKRREERKSGFSMQHGAAPEPPDIGPEDDPTGYPHSQALANDRLWQRHCAVKGRPSLSANLGRRR